MKRVVKMIMSVVMAGALFVSGLTGINAYADEGGFRMEIDETFKIHMYNYQKEYVYPQELFYNGESVMIGSVSSIIDVMDAYYPQHCNESGTYKYRIYEPFAERDEYYSWMTSGQWNNRNVLDEIEFEFSKPETALPKVNSVSFNNYEISWAILDNEENVYGYDIEHEYLKADGTSAYTSNQFIFKGNEPKVSFAYLTYEYSDNEAADRYRVRALSNDLGNYANGEWSDWTPTYSRKQSSQEIGAALDSVLETGTANDKLEALKIAVSDSSSQVASDTLRVGMASDATIQQKIADLETEYLAANPSVSVSTPTVSEEIKNETGIEASQVKITGAALNAGGAGTMGLEVAKPSEEADYADVKGWTQLEIKLTEGGEAKTGALDVPVAITMPLPATVSSSHLVIWHVHGDGTRERVAYRINSDGTFTFAVSSFSIFIFGNEIPSQGGDNAGGGYTASLETHVKNAVAQGAKTVEISGVQTLSIDDMRVLLANPTVSLVMNYTYEGKDYKVIIPAGAAVVDENIPWYGPLWLAGKYGNSYGMATPVGNDYVIAPGDTLAVIAAKLKTTIENLLKLNPYIKDRNVIIAGKTIKY